MAARTSAPHPSHRGPPRWIQGAADTLLLEGWRLIIQSLPGRQKTELGKESGIKKMDIVANGGLTLSRFSGGRLLQTEEEEKQPSAL